MKQCCAERKSPGEKPEDESESLTDLSVMDVNWLDSLRKPTHIF